jgi:hypothetical protein
MKLMPNKTQNSVTPYIKPLLAIMVCLMMVYTSCRKAENAPVPSAANAAVKTIPQDTLGFHVAINLSKSLAGGFGGVNLMHSVDSLSLAGHQGPHTGYNSIPLCGFFTDSLVSQDASQGDTVTHVGGNESFFFNCTNGQTAGYTAYDSLGTTRNTPKGLFQNFYVKQAYTIQCLDSKHEFVGVNGDNYFYQLVNIDCACTGTTYADVENSNYVLNNLKIDVCKQDILSGTATFKAYGYHWAITGTVTFLGNYLADMTIDGSNIVYHMNLKTLTITH